MNASEYLLKRAVQKLEEIDETLRVVSSKCCGHGPIENIDAKIMLEDVRESLTAAARGVAAAGKLLTPGAQAVSLEPIDCPAAKAMIYMRWHVAAYGSGAPADEIARQCAMTLGDAQDMLEWLQMVGRVAYRKSGFAPGWHETPDAEVAARGEAESPVERPARRGGP